MEPQQEPSDPGESRDQEGSLQEPIDFSELTIPEKQSGWRKAMHAIAAGGILGGAVIAGTMLGTALSERFVDEPGIEFRIPDGFSEEHAEWCAHHIAMAEGYYRLGYPGDPFYALNEQERADVQEFLEAIAPQLNPDADEWMEQASQQHFVRMLEDLDSELAPHERARGDRMLGEFFDAQRADSWTTQTDQDNKAREVFYLLISCSGSAQEMCIQRLGEIDHEARSLNKEEVMQYARKNIVDMKKNYDKSRKRAEQALVSGSVDGGFLSFLDITPGSIAAFRGDLQELDQYREENKRGIYTCEINGVMCSDWQIEIYDYGGDDYTVTLRNMGDETLFCTEDLRDLHVQLMLGGIDPKLHRVAQDAVLEQEHADQMTSYDLPEDAEITYLRVFAPTSDPVIASWIHTSMLLANAMESRYGDQMMVPAHMMSSNPKSDLVDAIVQRLAESDEKQHFVIDLYEHGDLDRLGFPVDLTGSDIADIARAFPECTFDVTSIACFGGGLQRTLQWEFQRTPELAERVNLFVHTRPNESNLTSEVTPERGMLIPTRGSLYHYHMIEALLDEDFKTFGEILRHSDIETKKHAPLDAQSLVDGMLITGIEGESNQIIV